MADSGHKSRTSKIIGILLNLEIKYPAPPTNNGGDVTTTTSNFPFTLNKPAHKEENIKEKYPHKRPIKPLL